MERCSLPARPSRFHRDVNLGPQFGRQEGFNLIIKGIRVNASTVGDDEDIVANVMSKERRLTVPRFKVADVTTGLA